MNFSEYDYKLYLLEVDIVISDIKTNWTINAKK